MGFSDQADRALEDGEHQAIPGGAYFALTRNYLVKLKNPIHAVRFLRSLMKFENSNVTKSAGVFLPAMRVVLVGLVTLLTVHVVVGQSAPHLPKGIVSDWTYRHILYRDLNEDSTTVQFQTDPRREQSWYLRHRQAWWPEYHPDRSSLDENENGEGEGRRDRNQESRRDWSISLGTAPFEPLFDCTFNIAPEVGHCSLNATDQGGGTWLATAGSLTVTGGSALGTYTLIPGGPGVTTSPLDSFYYDNLFTPSANPTLDVDGLLFGVTGLEVNIWGNSASNYSFYDSNATQNYPVQVTGTGTVAFLTDPGGGQSFPAKFVFDVTAAPSCSNDFVAIGLPSEPASGGQANIFGVNNLYSSQPASPAPNCTTNGPTVMFAYASGTGEVPASVAISLKGTQLAYVENRNTGESYFHVLTIGTTGSNGTSPTAAVVPGTGNNAVDQTVLLSPDGGLINQSSTSAPFISYTNNDVSDTAYVTTYSSAGSGSGYLYKIGNVFSSSAPTILWSVSIDAIPSSPVYDSGSNSVFFTDSNGRIDYVVDSGTSPSVTYGPMVAGGTTSLNPVVVDNSSQYVYACFNTNGTNAIVVQAPASLASFVSVAVGTGNTTYTGPYGVDFNNAWYTGSGTPLLYVVGTGSGTTPTLYSVGFNGSLLNGTTSSSAPLATAGADASPITEYYNPTLAKDYLFAGVTNHCVATTGGGAAGCVMSLDITAGFPTVNAGTTSLAAAGGPTGIIVDNDNTILSQASSIYYATKTGNTLVKATQSALK
jgi:hypothetical protein